jgi:hypothetical protein
MYKFAQIKDGQVVCLSELSAALEMPELIPLDAAGQFNGRAVQLGDLWDGSNFAPAPEV